MKINDYEIQKIVSKLMQEYDFNSVYSNLTILAKPEMPDFDLQDLREEARNLILLTLQSFNKLNYKIWYAYSSNFKVTVMNADVAMFPQVHLDAVLKSY